MNVTQIVMRRRDSLGRHLGYGFVRYNIRGIEGARTVTCPCCGYMSLTDMGYDVCTLCSWCDDGQDDDDPARPWNSPRGEMSLAQSRIMFQETMTTLRPDHEFYSTEQALLPLKRELIAVFDMMCGPIDGKRFVDNFRAAHRIMGEISERRRDLHDKRQCSQANDT